MRGSDVQAVGEYEQLSGICQFRASSEGTLEVVFSASVLTYERFRFLTERMASEDLASLSDVVFDFSAVEEIRSPWTPVMALLILLMRRSSFACHVRSIHGQPANVVGQYRRNKEIHRLLTAPHAL